jgi:drug/metabolite transporter (DMT)-like permease
MLTAIIWGMGFVAQKSGMEHVGPFFFAGARYLLAAITILIVVLITGAAAKRNTAGVSSGIISKHLLKSGILCGIVLFAATSFQQVGIVTTTASKTGFLTALYMVLVPVLGIFLKKHTHWNTWVSVLIATVGLYFLCITSDFSILPGDLIVLLGAFLWAGHILVIDRFVPSLTQHDILKLVTVQFLVSSALSMICGPLFDMSIVPIPLSAEIIAQAVPALLYSGVVSAGVGFTLQAVGQKYANPTAAAIILSLESVFSVIGGMLILGEKMTGREALGCLLMFLAVVLSQIPVRGKSDLDIADNAGGKR